MKPHVLACWLLVIPMCMAKDGYFPQTPVAGLPGPP